MKKIVLLMLLLSMLIFSSCGKTEQADKMYYSIRTNNLQGLREVLADAPELDINELNHHEFTAFKIYDRRALSFALDGCADETFILELLSSGKVDANNADDDMTYLDYAINNGFSLQIAEALIRNGADVNEGKETCLQSFLGFVYPDMPGKKERIDFCVNHGAIIDESLLSAALKNEYKYFCMMDVIELLKKRKIDIPDKYSGLVAAATGDEKALLEIASKESEKIKTTELILAAGTCSTDTLRRLEEAGCNFDIEDENKWTPLHIAALYNNKEAMEFFVERGLDLNAKASFYEYNPLDAAVIGENYETVEYLLEQGETSENMWALACEEKTGKFVEYLIGKGYKPTEADIYYALVTGTDRVAEKIIEKGFSVDINGEDGVPVDWVGTEERMITLLQNGAVITGDTLSRAVDLRAYDAMDIIIERGGDIRKNEALLEAVSIGDLEAVKKLVGSGAEINQLTYVEAWDGKYTAMHVAAWSTSRDILRYLIDHGGDSTIKDSNGKTPYKWAKEMRNKENEKLLR